MPALLDPPMLIAASATSPAPATPVITVDQALALARALAATSKTAPVTGVASLSATERELCAKFSVDPAAYATHKAKVMALRAKRDLYLGDG